MIGRLTRWVRFNLRYLGQPPWDTGVSPPELIDFLAAAPPGLALDLGCGTGTNLLAMASYGWQVVGVDIAWIPVLKARARLRRAGILGRVIRGNIAGHPPIRGAFDLVLDIGAFHSLGPEERQAYRQNLLHWLNPGGTYLLYAHRKTEPTDLHGVSEVDFVQFSRILDLMWRTDSGERRPDGGGGRPAVWGRFVRSSQS